MNHSRTRQLGKVTKAIYLIVGVMFLMLGMLGFILPVIPGLLFIVLAVYLFSKVSLRVRRFSERSPVMVEMHSRLDRSSHLPILARIKLVSLMAVEMTVRAMAALTERMTSRRGA
ncbi:MAG: DUF454 family protein [Pseudomonadales bacterium]|nr:DUF454 family protein [Pseudomonadales bacterium]